MHISLLTPYLEAQRGNAITARRLAAGLAAGGVEADVYGFCDAALPAVALTTDLIHAFHAYHTGRVVLPQLPSGVPLVLTMTGTDYNIDLYREDRRATVLAALERAQRVVVFHQEAARQLIAADATLAAKLSVIPPGICLPDQGLVAAPPGVGPDDKVILIVAGLRQVKNVPAAIEAVAALGRPDVKLVHAGPALEEAAAAEVRQAAERYPWFISLGEVAFSEMAALYRRAAIVVNTSHSEAIPGCILEAMYLGRPVVVAGIAGNRAAVIHGQTGLIYETATDLVSSLASLLDNEAAAAAMGGRAARHVRDSFSPDEETAAYCQLYQAVPEKEG